MGERTIAVVTAGLSQPSSTRLLADRTVVVPTSVFAASIDWGENGRREGTLQRRVELAAAELARLVVDRPGGSTSDDLVSAPFKDLLLRR